MLVSPELVQTIFKSVNSIGTNNMIRQSSDKKVKVHFFKGVPSLLFVTTSLQGLLDDVKEFRKLPE